MQVVRLQNLAELQPWIGQWNALARDVPFCRWEWVESWWRHYGQDRGHPRRNQELYILAVLDEPGRLVGLAPWYLERTASSGRTVRFLGSGEVCSEYLSVLCRGGADDAVAESLAQWLTQCSAGPDVDRWDVLKLAPVERDDPAVARLLEHLARHGHATHAQPSMSCWRLALPASWEQYLAARSKSHRKQLRRLDRDYFRSGRAVMHWVHEPGQLSRALDRLIALHQRRWQACGQPGCFSRKRFEEFHRAGAPGLWDAGSLLLGWLELDGRAAAAEYHLAGRDIVYAYQSGIEPELLAHQPGHLSNLATIRRAIERGDRAVDFLRGDEPYKAHWGAVPREMREYRVISTRLAARLRQGLWTAGDNVLGWLKSGWQMAESLVAE